MNRRKRRRRYNAYRGQNIKGRALSVVLVICLSVAAGYMTATQVLGPALGLETQQTFLDFVNDKTDKTENKEEKNSETTTVVEDQVEVDTDSGYALQYGSFSTEEGAQECLEDLTASGIEAEIIEKDGMYKVIGQLFNTKEEARTFKEENSQNEDVFITEIP